MNGLSVQVTLMAVSEWVDEWVEVQVTLIVSERVECASAESFAEELRLKYKLIVAPVAD